MSGQTNSENVENLSVGSVDQTFLITEPTILETRNGDPYLRGRVQDKTGGMKLIQFDCCEAPEPGLYRVSGVVEEYNGDMQVKADGIEPTDGDLDEYVPASHRSREALEDELFAVIDSLKGEVGEVVRRIFDDSALVDAFLEAPAATKNHHAYRRGLAEHTLSMCRLAASVHDHYLDLYTDLEVDRDLLVAGALLHDLGKAETLEAEGPTHEYGPEGQLVGHIAVCVSLIHDAALGALASDRTRQRLTHMVLSHHGKKEWGSPVEPKIVEAEILHHIDVLDSRTEMFLQAVDGLEDGEQSEWVRPLGRKVVR